MRFRIRAAAFLALFFLGIFLPARLPAAEPIVLDNGRIRAEFGERGLTALADKELGKRLEFRRDFLSITLGDRQIGGSALGPAELETTPSRLKYTYSIAPDVLEIVYELRPGWRFLSKHAVLTRPSGREYKVRAVEAMDAELGIPVLDELLLNNGAFGTLLRFGGGGEPASRPSWGVFFMLQNPFLAWKREGAKISASYLPEMDWKSDYGPFTTDRLCIGIYELGGMRFPARAVPEWKFVPDYGKFLAGTPSIDAEEVEALTDCVRAFLLYRPSRSIRVHIPWCENDYQIDVAAAEGAEEYRRIMDMAAELGCRHFLFTPANSGLSRLEDNADAWGWENLLFFGLGQKIRKDEWNPAVDPVPPSIQPFLDYAAQKSLGLMAYAYPSLPFKQNPEWTKWAGEKVSGTRAADTGLRSFQDWWLAKLLAFMKTTGAAGFSFDHWWIAYDGASGRYAQWFGCRRILESLRRREPGVFIDGRQQYQNFGPWTWLAGTYPHPTLTDEQPESFVAFPDLSTDRVSANRQRFAAWTYRVERFCPPEIMPGFITHQSERSDAAGVMRRDRFRPRDWDVLGWKYSLLSSIGTAPFNHVVNFIPARDPEEFKALSEEDKFWFRQWLDWTDRNADILRRMKPILGPPMIGRIDGTAAVREDRGFVFLFNPNPGALEARFRLDRSIGLTGPGRYLIGELHPREGMLVPAPGKGFWDQGDEIVLPMPGCQAQVLEIRPAPESLKEPLLFNSSGDVVYRNNRMILSKVAGEAGTGIELLILLPSSARLRSLNVNGILLPFKQKENVVTAGVRFSGKAFSRFQRIGNFDPAFAGGVFKARFSIPARVFRQLADRKKAWPVSYTEDDLLAPWLGPWRLLLFAPIAEPDDSQTATLTIDAKPVAAKKAYNSVYPHEPKRTYMGVYADVSGLRPDVVHTVEASIPPLSPGRFLGLFFVNVETEYTTSLGPARPAAKRRR